ncbi:hypothetical protein DC345_25395 [Paenibacillus taichungensis]|uniref:Uncharacterized protein n=1 Tax=Paenibacillus taichungensis TaxID=484184 RepID=A0A329QL76_9BACL|nr:hypothetical protein DC345_25395 [Paenibacillus taichungensis]
MRSSCPGSQPEPLSPALRSNRGPGSKAKQLPPGVAQPLSPALRSNRGPSSQTKQLPRVAARALKPRLAEQQGPRQPSEAAAPWRSPALKPRLAEQQGLRQPGEAAASGLAPQRSRAGFADQWPAANGIGEQPREHTNEPTIARSYQPPLHRLFGGCPEGLPRSFGVLPGGRI